MKFTLRFIVPAMAAILVVGTAIALVRSHDQPRDTVQESTIAVADFENRPLEEVLTELCKSGGARLVIDRKNIDQARIDLRCPVTLHCRGIQLQEALDRALIAGRCGRCGMQWKGNDVLVTTIRSLPSTSRMYDIGDLTHLLAESGNTDGDYLLGFYVDLAIEPDLNRPSGKPAFVCMAGTRMIVTAPTALHRRVGKALLDLREIARSPGRAYQYDAHDLLDGTRAGTSWGEPFRPRDKELAALVQFLVRGSHPESSSPGSVQGSDEQVIVQGSPMLHLKVRMLLWLSREMGSWRWLPGC